ncbi:18939_t:CDS:1, partial [Racocetra fulgida]
MNRQTFNSFLFVLLSILLALTITVSARINIPINKHANKHDNKHTPTKTKCSTPTPKPTCCQSRGSPGWNDKFHLASGGGIDYTNITTAQDCCNACIADPNCFQWYFVSGVRCLIDNRDACSHVTITPSGDITPSGGVAEGGIIRCSDGSGS